MEIIELQICTADLSKQIEFYSNIIGLDLLEHTGSEAKFQVGNSILIFKQSNNFTPYHFAFNIPSNQGDEALSYLKARKIKILKHNDQELQAMNDWQAEGIYFYDPDKNIVEFIARKTLKNESQETFSSKSLLEISEIGMPVSEIESTYSTLQGIVKPPIYDGNFERFCAIGDELGMFICINKEIKDWFPTGDKAYSSPFNIVLKVDENIFNLEFKNGMIDKSNDLARI